MHTLKKITFLLITLALLCSSSPTAQAQDAPDAGPRLFLPSITSGEEGDGVEAAKVKLVVSTVISPAKQKAALDLWTHEAIAAAQPLAMPAQFGPAMLDEAALSAPTVALPAGFAAAGAAAPSADAKAQAAYPSDWAALEQELVAAGGGEPAGTSQTYTSYIVNQASALWKIYPHRWVGRLSFSTPSGTSFCSGTSISGNVMLTAAHCVYDTTNNQFYSNWAFTPAYRNGSAPYGTFPATTCWVLTSWVNLTGSFNINTWSQHDVAVCKMGNNSAGSTLNNAVGFMGRQWNASYIRHFHDVGYPFNDFNNATLTNAGKYQRLCAAESFQQATETRGVGCNWGPGISGGPWIANYAPTLVSGNADGVNSGFFIGTQNLYGARFNSNNIVPLCTSAGC